MGQRMNNKISDLNNILFEQMERINDDSLTEEELNIAIKKADAINSIAKTVVDNARNVIQAQKMLAECDGYRKVDMTFLGVSDE